MEKMCQGESSTVLEQKNSDSLFTLMPKPSPNETKPEQKYLSQCQLGSDH